MPDLRKYPKILILRTAGMDQDAVAQLMRCRKKTVGEAEQWAVDSNLRMVQDLVTDERIRRIREQEFPGLGLGEAERRALENVTAEEILLRYGRVPRQGNGWALPPDLERVRRHHDHLLQVAGMCSDQLVVPSLQDIFSPDRLSRNVSQLDPGSLIWSPPWQSPWLEMRPADGRTGIRLAVEQETLFPHFRAHMQSEAPEFLGLLDTWKDGLGAFLQRCRNAMERAVRDCTAATGQDYVGGAVTAGLFPTAPAYVCRRALLVDDPGDAPVRQILPDHVGTWKLVPADYPAWALATGDRPGVERCREALMEVIALTAGLPDGKDIRGRHRELEHDRRILQDLLRALIERGDIGGTCPLCPG